MFLVSTEQTCGFLCHFCLFFKHCNLGWMVRNSNIQGFLLNPFRTELCHLFISPYVVMFASVQYCVSPNVGLCESSVLAYFLYLAACYTFSP